MKRVWPLASATALRNSAPISSCAVNTRTNVGRATTMNAATKRIAIRASAVAADFAAVRASPKLRLLDCCRRGRTPAT